MPAGLKVNGGNEKGGVLGVEFVSEAYSLIAVVEVCEPIHCGLSAGDERGVDPLPFGDAFIIQYGDIEEGVTDEGVF